MTCAYKAPIFVVCISKILLFGCSFSNRHVMERCSKPQVALLSESKLKFAVITINHFTKETSLLSNITKVFLHCFQERERDIVVA